MGQEANENQGAGAPPAPDTGAGAAGAATTPPAPPAAADAPAAAAGAAGANVEDVASLPDWAQKLLGKTRSEAATNRTKASTANQALEATRTAIAQALGLAPEDDPIVAAKTAHEKAEAEAAVARNLRAENAVLRSAGRHGANADALTDSRSFMKALEAIDATADDFAKQVDDAIKAAVEANPNLKVAGAPAPAPARSGGPVGGGAGTDRQLTRADLKDMGPDEIEEARKAGRLNQLLGIKATA